MHKLPLLVGLALAAATLPGCSVEAGDNLFVFQWVVVACIVLVALVGTGLSLAMDEPGLGGVWFLVCGGLAPRVYRGLAGFWFLVCGVLALWVYPGLPSQMPSNVERRENEVERQRQRQVRVHAERAASPRGQRERTQRQIGQLRTKISEEYEPREAAYTDELQGYLRTLRRDLPKTGLKSQEELLRNREEHLELAFTLDKAAKTKFWIDWLGQRRTQAQRTLVELEHKEWELGKRVDLGEIASEAELEEIEATLARAQVLIDERTPGPERQDVAVMQEAIFTEILGN
jgi:hypothetical protein